MNWVDGDASTAAHTGYKGDNPNNAFPWIAIDLGSSTACKIYKIRLRGSIPLKAGHLNVSKNSPNHKFLIVSLQIFATDIFDSSNALNFGSLYTRIATVTGDLPSSDETYELINCPIEKRFIVLQRNNADHFIDLSEIDLLGVSATK